jgi:hypothetical protein
MASSRRDYTRAAPAVKEKARLRGLPIIRLTETLHPKFTVRPADK